ncbi:hypothetical protein FA95DRAFT_1555896 [Auriscalpium vulgare]|uniref:Uncharacterized protein n=1 Tax=Auriscalpium vulgare TaxID=40419 RepID=A0ACB8S1H1_9AGAM|nr:hypothetical protein FA95DRAFT_1555896 [Auriscalpium vulgare]
MDHLTPEFDPKITRGATKLQYGILITGAAVVKLTQANNLLTAADLEDRDDPTEPVDYQTCRVPLIKYLRKKTGAYLYLRNAFSRVDTLLVITLYDNYSMERERYEDANEKRVIEIVQEITGIKDIPRWHYDFSCNF